MQKLIPKNNAVKEYQREQWSVKVIPRNITPTIITTIFYQVILFLSFLFILFLLVILNFSVIDFVATSIGRLTFLTILLIIFIDIVGVILYILGWKATRYELESGSYKVLETFVDIKPGKIGIEKGLFFKRISIHTAEEYERAELREGFIQKIFNTGTIILHGKQKENKPNLNLIDVYNPSEYVSLIQDMIDDVLGDNLIDVNAKAESNKVNPNQFYQEPNDNSSQSE